jgi:hypothetical protein
MSISNVFSACYGWRVDPDGRQDRKSGPVREYRLTPEELEKYKQGADKMREAKITKEQLIADCREHGLSPEAIKRIAEKRGVDARSVYARIAQHGIRQLLKDEAVEAVRAAAAEERSVKRYYTSTSYTDKDRAAKLAAIVEALGGKITYKWWDMPDADNAEGLGEIGEAELEAVRCADVVIVMLPGRWGTHVELGAALALGKKVLLHSPAELEAVPFYYVNGVQRVAGADMDLIYEIWRSNG